MLLSRAKRLSPAPVFFLRLRLRLVRYSCKCRPNVTLLLLLLFIIIIIIKYICKALDRSATKVMVLHIEM